MADKKSQNPKNLSEDEMKKQYKLLLQLGTVEMVNDLKLLDSDPLSKSGQDKPKGEK